MKVQLDSFDAIDNFDELSLEHWKDFNTRLPAFNKEVLRKLYVITARNKENKVVGYLFFMVFNSPYYGDQCCQVDMFYLQKMYRKQGIGKQMFQLLEQVAKELGCKQLFSSSNLKGPLDSFYSKLGYNATHTLVAKEI